jgi:hypothetical protein
MILGDMVGTAAESPGSKASGQGVKRYARAIRGDQRRPLLYSGRKWGLLRYGGFPLGEEETSP